MRLLKKQAILPLDDTNVPQDYYVRLKAIKTMRKVPYPHPGEILSEEFLKPMSITPYRLAKEIGVPQGRIGEIICGTRSVTADTALRLSRFFGMSDGFWLGLQMDYDGAKAKDSLSKTLPKIIPWKPMPRGQDHTKARPKVGDMTGKLIQSRKARTRL